MRNVGTLEVWYIICYRFVLKWLNWECWLTCGDYMNMDIVVLSLEIVLWYYIDRDMEFDHNGALCGRVEIGTILMHCYILHCHSISLLSWISNCNWKLLFWEGIVFVKQDHFDLFW